MLTKQNSFVAKMNVLNDIDILPDEMLAEVASFLLDDDRASCTFSCVCCRFYGVGHDVFDQGPAFQHACYNGYTDIVKLFLTNSRVDPTADNNCAIRKSSENGHTEVVKLLLADGRADPAADDNWAIRLSSWKGYTDIVRLLLEDGRADPAADDNYAICVSSHYRRAAVVKLLLDDRRIDPTAIGHWDFGENWF